MKLATAVHVPQNTVDMESFVMGAFVTIAVILIYIIGKKR